MHSGNIKIITNREITNDIINLRNGVFVVEQKINPIYEFTGDDDEYTHLSLYVDDQIIGTLRYKIVDTHGKIGRVAIKKEYRKLGYGKIIMLEAEEQMKKNGAKDITLGSQMHVSKFYESLGYKQFGEVFLDAEIEHIMMTKKLE